MSYSFSAQGSDKASARKAAEEAFDKMVETQPIHAKDKDAAMANLDTVMALVIEDAECDVAVHCNGYLSWRSVDADGKPTDVTGASVASSVSLITRPTCRS